MAKQIEIRIFYQTTTVERHCPSVLNFDILNNSIFYLLIPLIIWDWGSESKAIRERICNSLSNHYVMMKTRVNSLSVNKSPLYLQRHSKVFQLNSFMLNELNIQCLLYSNCETLVITHGLLVPNID